MDSKQAINLYWPNPQLAHYLQPLLLLFLSLRMAPALLVKRPLVLLGLRDTLGVGRILVSVEILPAIDTGQDLAARALVLPVFLHLVLLQRRPTRVASKEHHVV